MRLYCAILLVFIPAILLGQSPFDTLEHIHKEAVYFDFGKYDLRPGAGSTLTQLVSEFPDPSKFSVYITAHTDSIGTLADNQRLSLNRAGTVKEFLVGNGWKEDRIVVQVFGEEQPTAENSTDEGRQRNRRATIDIYLPRPMARVKGRIKDGESGDGVLADIIVRTQEWEDSIRTDSSGYFSYKLPENTVVGLDIYAPGYFFETQMLKTSQGGVSKDLDINLKPLKEGESIDIKNLYFVGDQAILLDRSKPELPKILKMMDLNPGLAIEIAGHINWPNRPKVERDSWHFGLSVRRAKLVYDYLIENDINPSRITYKGYGNWEMRYPHASTAKEQELNRRVEIRVLETGEKLGKTGEDGY